MSSWDIFYRRVSRVNVNVSSNNLVFYNLGETLLFNNQENEIVELK